MVKPGMESRQSLWILHSHPSYPATALRLTLQPRSHRVFYHISHTRPNQITSRPFLQKDASKDKPINPASSTVLSLSILFTLPPAPSPSHLHVTTTHWTCLFSSPSPLEPIPQESPAFDSSTQSTCPRFRLSCCPVDTQQLEKFSYFLKKQASFLCCIHSDPPTTPKSKCMPQPREHQLWNWGEMFVQNILKSIQALHFHHERLQTILRFQGLQRLNGGGGGFTVWKQNINCLIRMSHIYFSCFLWSWKNS